MSVRVEEFVFEPAVLSTPELHFLLDHVTESPKVALAKGTPAGVNAAEIDKWLTQFRDLNELQQAHGTEWAGYDAIKDSILRYIAWQERTKEIYNLTGGARSKAGAIANASQYAWTEDGKEAFKGAGGADSAEAVRTEILDDGSRRPFAVKLLMGEGHVPLQLSSVAPWVSKTPASNKDAVEHTQTRTHGTFTCSICSHTEQYAVGNTQQRSGAWARMARHCGGAKSEVARHKLLRRKTFESPSAKL